MAEAVAANARAQAHRIPQQQQPLGARLLAHGTKVGDVCGVVLPLQRFRAP